MKNVLGAIHLHVSVRDPCAWPCLIAQRAIFHGHAHGSRADRWLALHNMKMVTNTADDTNEYGYYDELRFIWTRAGA